MTAPLTALLERVEADKIRHALGWPKDYRNHFVTDADGPDGLVWRGLVERGLATASAPCTWMSDMTVYRVTEAGRAALHALASRDAAGPADAEGVEK